ncbi:carbonic anhydrase [Shewanella surugensis]|uniref:Carbonic anhydrase n=1 Tax=Shewanella surugensis TaxID=212020 RepID=A0ABT0L9B1_9GAMM|nr:carbonic anhydrase [Shewanella surugensis]MCL1124286.1 carbonic anhydrase [Shewanella surugensis]
MIYERLLEKNIEWAEKIKRNESDFFEKNHKEQKPNFLWIGCSDSRVPSDQIMGTMPGEIFVHRNIANLVVNSDINCLSVLQYAVETLKVKHILVVGHYGCGGVRAAMEQHNLGIIGNWLNNIKDVYNLYENELSPLDDDKLDRLCELSVIEQVKNVGRTSIIENARCRGQEISIHGWIYNLKDGKIKDLGVNIDLDKSDECQSCL